MNWNPLYWWTVAGLLVALELVSGTFYLLAIGLALAAGGFAAWAGLSFAAQLLVAAAVGVVLVPVLQRWRERRLTSPAQGSLDVGNAVQVASWHEGGRARVNYRGAQWDAELQDDKVSHQQTLYITGVRGSTLILSDHPPRA
jgi:membrane protein implicated in regulation of membrane protease activity